MNYFYLFFSFSNVVTKIFKHARMVHIILLLASIGLEDPSLGLFYREYIIKVACHKQELKTKLYTVLRVFPCLRSAILQCE